MKDAGGRAGAAVTEEISFSSQAGVGGTGREVTHPIKTSGEPERFPDAEDGRPG